MGTVIPSAIEAAQGLYLGHYFVSSKQYSEEVKQGKNYYLAFPFQFWQAVSCNWMINQLLDCAGDLPLKGTLSKIKGVVLCVFPLPFFLLAATSKHEHYQIVAEWVNNLKVVLKERKKSWAPYLSYLPDFPKTLSKRTVATLHMAAEHADRAMHLFLIASSITLIANKRYAFGFGSLAMFAYAWVDERGWVKREWSLFVERYAPLLALSCFKNPSIASLLVSLPRATILLPRIKKIVFYALDEMVVKIGNKYLPTKLHPLSEIDAPLVERRDLSYEECKRILKLDISNFDINRTHCARWVYDLSSLPSDRDFAKFLTLFKKVDWKNQYKLIIPKLLDDERFQAILKDRFPDLPLEDLKKNIDTRILELGLKGKTKEECAAEWLQQQMEMFVDVLLGKVRVKGKQTDLEDALPIYSVMLPYLSSLKAESAEFQDALLKIAVEGGDYCARGLKRVAFEFKGDLIRNKLKQEYVDPAKEYELLINQALQEFRGQILEKAYTMIINHNQQVGNAVSKLAYDVHNLDNYRICLGFGFYPLTYNEKESFLSLERYYSWRGLEELRGHMYREYKEGLDRVIKENGGEVAFSDYIRKTIESLPNLTEEEKKELLSIYQGGEYWSAEEMNENFHRLMFVIWGVLKLNESRAKESAKYLWEY